MHSFSVESHSSGLLTHLFGIDQLWIVTIKRRSKNAPFTLTKVDDFIAAFMAGVGVVHESPVELTSVESSFCYCRNSGELRSLRRRVGLHFRQVDVMARGAERLPFAEPE